MTTRAAARTSDAAAAGRPLWSVRGHGRLAGTRQVAVEATDGTAIQLAARHAVVICTGSRPALPALAGLAEARPWTNRHATDSSSAPRSPVSAARPTRGR